MLRRLDEVLRAAVLGGQRVGSSDPHRRHLPERARTATRSADFQGGDRRLGDFFTVNYDLNGNIIIAAADTRLAGALDGGPKPVSNPIFMKQNGGDPLLEQPIPARPTRPLCDDPVNC